MKTQLISSMASFVLGTGVTLVALASWLGTSDLESIKQAVVQLDSQAEGQAQAFVENYTVTVDQANAEIGEYKVALQQANDNISQLITAYEDKVDEMEQAQASAEQDLADLQQALADMQTRLDSQYETDMNAIIEQANAEINQANIEVAETKEYVDLVLENSRTNGIAQDRIAETGKVLDTTGDKSVTDISSIVPQE